MRFYLTLAISLALHAAMAFGMVVVLPMLDVFEPPAPLMVEMVTLEPEPEPELAPPEPAEPEPAEPEVVEPEPVVEPERVVQRDPTPVPPQAPDEPPPPDAPPPAEEAIADFTGETLTNDQGASWNSATGNGAVMEGPIGQPNATVTGRRREGARGGAIGGTGDGEPGPRTVAVGNLSRSPGAPLGRLQQLLRQNVPRRAQELGLEGDARVRIRVRADGRVVTLAVLSEDHDGFGEACRRTIRAAGRWEPPLDRNGEAVDTVTTFRCTFETDF